ncbi:hypothetical protein D3C85_1828090 [compost metagenome]
MLCVVSKGSAFCIQVGSARQRGAPPVLAVVLAAQQCATETVVVDETGHLFSRERTPDRGVR